MQQRENERRLAAKIPGEDTGIQVKRTVCNVCCSSFYCGMNAYIKDGRIIKVEGDPEHPLNHGLLCTKGLASKDYIYSPRRIRTPLKRVGARGEGKFVPISWEEAYREIAEKLGKIKEEDGAEAVAFFTGIEKWYQAFLHRLAYSFGSPNFGSDNSTCFEATHVAWNLCAGTLGQADVNHAKTYLAFSMNQYYSRCLDAVNLEKRRKEGMKVIIVDPRVTPAVKRIADIHLQNLPGTDGAVALGMAHLLIKNGWIDREYIEKYVYGFEEFATYVEQFDPERVEQISRVKKEDLCRAVELMAHNLPMAVHESVSPIVHHKNGMQNYRAMIALSAITGCYDRVGGQRPRVNSFSHQTAGFDTREEEFVQCRRPKNVRPSVGSERFPLWEDVAGEMQAMDLARQILEEKPYPIKGLVGFGMNFRMFPQDGKIKEAIEKLDFFMDVDLFLTDTAKMADIVLPACTAAEREEFKVYRGGLGIYTKPVIEPLYESRSDCQIISEMAAALDVDDPLLRSGYDSCMEYILQDLSVSVEDFKRAELPIHVPEAKPYEERAYTKKGYRTPTGKFELYSTVIAGLPARYGLDPLPTYRDSATNADDKSYPFILFTGSSIPHAYNSRLHDVDCLRAMRPDPQADISLEDGNRLGITNGDMIEVATEIGAIRLKANVSSMILPGTVSIFHGYREADVNTVISWDHLDPYSGFPGFRSVRCQIRKITKGEE